MHFSRLCHVNSITALALPTRKVEKVLTVWGFFPPLTTCMLPSTGSLKKKILLGQSFEAPENKTDFICLVNYERNLLLWSPFCKSFTFNWNSLNTKALYMKWHQVSFLQTVTQSRAKDDFSLLFKRGTSLSLRLKTLPPILCGPWCGSDALCPKWSQSSCWFMQN